MQRTSSEELHEGKQKKRSNDYEDDCEDPSLLSHGDSRIRLRAVVCLEAHIDLLISDVDRVSQALHSQLRREENPHVTQQIVRLLASLVISTCKLDEKSCTLQLRDIVTKPNNGVPSLFDRVLPNPDNGCNATCEYCKEPATATASISKMDRTLFPSVPERARHIVKTLSLYGLADTQTLTLKLQVLRSLHQIAEKTGAVQMTALTEQLRKLLASNSPFLRAYTLRLVAIVRVTDRGTEVVPGNETIVSLFERYAHDAHVLVRKAALQSMVLLCSNGYMLTRECYLAASTLLDDVHENICSLSLKVISLWVEQNPDNSNCAFSQVCRMITNMELSVRIEACRALSFMRSVREDLLLQALSKQPLKVSAKVKDLGSYSLDVSKHRQGLRVLDTANMGAFVHGIEDEFYEVRGLTLRALASFLDSSTRVRTGIMEVMMLMLSDDSKHVRLMALGALIHLAHQHGLLVGDDDLYMVHGTLEDIDGDVQYAGKMLLAEIKLSSVESLKSTVQCVMKHIRKTWKGVACPDNDIMMRVLYKLGRAHSTYVRHLAGDLLKELKGYLMGEAGLDVPECGCILVLLMAASEVDSSIASLVPGHLSSLARLYRKNASRKFPMLECDNPQLGMTGSKNVLCMDESLAGLRLVSDERKLFRDCVENTVRASWNSKSLLFCGAFAASRQVLRDGARFLKRLISNLVDEDQLALVSYAIHYLDCLELVWQGHIHLKGDQAMSRIHSLRDLSSRLEFVVQQMGHAYVGHSIEQELALGELNVVAKLWRIISAVDMNDQGELQSAVQGMHEVIDSGSFTPFMEEVLGYVLQAGAMADVIKLHDFIRQQCLLYWPRLLDLDSVKEMKVGLTIAGSDMECPTPFLPDMPVGIEINVSTTNIGEKSRLWVRLQLESLWTDFVFLDLEDHLTANQFVMLLPIRGFPCISKCVLKAAIMLECPVVGARRSANSRGPQGSLIPLSSEKLIHVECSSTIEMF